MTTRKYSSRSQQSTLTGSVTSGATSITVVSGTGLLGGVTIPSGTTFTLVIDPDTAIEEIVDATAVSTNTFTITRAIDGSSAQEHSAGAVVRHMAIGRDYRDANLHAEATGGYNDGSGNAHTMHGIAAGEGDVVGTLKTQTLTNKTLTSPLITDPTITGTAAAGASIVFEGATSDDYETTLTVVDPTQDNTITLPNTTGTVTINNATQTLSNKTLGNDLNAGGFKITNLATPTNASDAVRKDFADAQVAAAATSAASAATSASSAATSASSASTSASSALTSANSASASASAAATSAASAATSASTMAASVAAAATSAASAATSASSAATSATAAATSATSAAASATAAATSATSSASSATLAQNWATQLVTPVSGSDYSAKYNANLAATSATSAATSASSSATSATAAATSATSAAASATAAATSATSAAASATAAATSATSAAASATAAASSATAAAASAASVDATATAATELRQYAAEDSILPNLPARVPVAEGLLKQAAYWVDATNNAYIPTTASGYMYLPGVSGNYASTPDAAALDITGDIDLRVKVGLDFWIGSSGYLLTKYGASGNRSFGFGMLTNGGLYLNWTTGGTTLIEASGDTPTGITNGATKWVRATLDVNNGAGGYEVKFYTSDNGSSWTQLGSTITGGSTTSIYSGSAPVEVGGVNGGTSPSRGKFYRAQILNGIGGTTVFDANFETAMTSQTVASFTESSTNSATVTINRNTYNFQLDTLSNLGWTGNLLPTTLGSGTAADSNDPKFLDWTGTNYVYTPGVNNNYLTIPDATALDVTGDIDIRAYVALDNWASGSVQMLVAKFTAAGQYSYRLYISATGAVVLEWSTDGTTVISKVSTVVNGITNGTIKWVRATLDVDNGASGNDVKFWLSDNGTTWTQLGSTVTTAGTTSIFNSTSDVYIADRVAASGQNAAGKFFRAQIFNGIDGTKVLDVDTSVITSGAATSFFALSGQTVTINRATSGRKTVAVVHPCWLFGTDDYMEVNNRYMSSGTYLYLPGIIGNYASAPDSNALDVAGDIDIRIKLAMDNWTSGTTYFMGKAQSAAASSWDFGIVNGTFQFEWTTTGTNWATKNATAAITFAPGTTKWIRATLDVDNGASGNDVAFYTSDDGTTWTQVGTTVTTAGTTSIYVGTNTLNIGQYSTIGGTGPTRGKFFRAQVLNGINGTVAFDANFETSITSLEQASFTESSANSATVTINRSGSAFRSAGITAAGYLYPGATNTFKPSSVDYLNFGASDSFTAFVVVRQWATPTSFGRFLAKSGTSTVNGYTLANNGTNANLYAFISDGTNTATRQALSTITAGSITSLGMVIDRSGNTLASFGSGTVSATTSTSSVGSLSNPYTLGIGRENASAGGYQDFEFIAAAIFRRALTAAEIATISTYYAGRVGA
jgi:hypothetical protein